MADVDHPKTHVEDQIAKGDIDLPRTQPESPQREGIDPLTEGDTLYPAENTKELSEKLDRKEAAAEPDTTETDTLVADQEEVAAKAATPNANLPEEDKLRRLNRLRRKKPRLLTLIKVPTNQPLLPTRKRLRQPRPLNHLLMVRVPTLPKQPPNNH
jgi:hypothetical protein